MMKSRELKKRLEEVDSNETAECVARVKARLKRLRDVLRSEVLGPEEKTDPKLRWKASRG